VSTPGGRQAVAIAVEFLQKNPLYHATLAGRPIVIVTTRGGANRAYESGAVSMKAMSEGVLVDDQNRRWRVTEAALVPVEHDGEPLPRLPAQRAFWFGWAAQYPETILIK
jgi:hypothetical protein